MVIRGFWCGLALEGLGFYLMVFMAVPWCGLGMVRFQLAVVGFFVGVVGGGWSQNHRKEQNFFLAEAYEFWGFLKRMF